jgi:Icc-related predicted phosphoesterase
VFCFFVTDLHGNIGKYKRLFKQIQTETPDLVFLGGDLLSAGFFRGALHNEDILNKTIAAGFQNLKAEMGQSYPDIFIIMGNDDPRCEEKSLIQFEKKSLWHYAHQRRFNLQGNSIFGYSFVPPTPFLNKDWERYDVSRFVDVGCVAPEEGYRSTHISAIEIQNSTIWDDLIALAGNKDVSKSIWLFHAPPYDTGLDRAALDGKMFDHAPLDVHVGSIAIRRFIEQHQPLVTLHGHIHESFSITGIWKEYIGNTVCLSAAGMGRKLTLVRFNTENPNAAKRIEL